MAAPLRFGLIGSGYMGRAHAIALHGAAATFGADYVVECALLADATPEQAKRAAAALGFAASTADWRELVSNPRIDVVDITTYHTDIARQLDTAIEVRKKKMNPPHPAWTAIGTTALAVPDGQTEIRVIAKLPERGPKR